MKNNRKLFVSIEVALAVMILIIAFIIFQERNGKDLFRISVIVQNSDDRQWSAFKYGLKMAAEDQKIDLVVVSTGERLSIEEQMNMMQQEIDYGADALIVQPIPGDDTEELFMDMEKKVPIMFVENKASKDASSLFPIIEPDHKDMGRALAEELLRDYNDNIDGKTIGIVTQYPDAPNALLRRKAFEETIKDTGAKIRWSACDTSAEDHSLEDQPRVDLVIALDDFSLIEAGEYSASGRLHGALVYGIGHSTESAYYLDIGKVECMIVPDEFNVGYQSLTQAAESVRFYHDMSSKTVSYTVIRRDELFTDENQEILFTMSQ